MEATVEFVDFQRLVGETRSTRRFKAGAKVSAGTLRELVGLARVTPSSRNLQPLKFLLVNESGAREDLFSCLSWARDLPEWGGPAPEERPAAYIVILGDKRIREDFGCDHGIAAQTMMLGARALGLSGCLLASVDRERLSERFAIAAHFVILLVMVIGAPAETIRIEEMPQSGEVRYWRDGEGVHHVPKRSLEELIAGEFVE
jgi:nitroreductase